MKQCDVAIGQYKYMHIYIEENEVTIEKKKSNIIQNCSIVVNIAIIWTAMCWSI